MLRNFSISIRFIVLMFITVLLLCGIMLSFWSLTGEVRDVGVENVYEVMLEGQKEKLKIATHSMAVALGEVIKDAQNAYEQQEIIRAGVDRIRFEEDKSGYFFVYEETVCVALPPKPETQGKDLAGTKDSNGLLLVEEMRDTAKAGGGFVEYIWPKPGAGDQPKFSYVEVIPGTNYWIGTGVYVDNVTAKRKAVNDEISQFVRANLFTVIGVVAGVVLLLFLPLNVAIIRSIIGPVARTTEAAESMADGALDVSLDESGRDEMTAMQHSFNRMVSSLKDKADVAERIAERDLTVEVALASDHDVLGTSLQKMVTNLRELLGKVNNAAGQIASGSTEVSDSSQSLSQGATEQAAALEQTNSSMTEMGERTRVNADNANQASEIARRQQEQAGKGAQEMGEMTAAMDEIKQSSQDIAKIIKVIDEIAFQTNLLALNAAVEAARAGRHGKGFAVVAEEVRNLAGRSAKAAEETAHLIEGAISKVETGAVIADKTAESLTRIVDGSDEVTSLVSEIATASSHQADAISQISQALSQIDKVTQQNTASAEETASAAEQLSSQSDYLKNALDQFRLTKDGAAHRAGSSGRGVTTKSLPFAAKSADKAVPKSTPEAEKGAWGEAEVVEPEEIISLDDDEFGKY